MVPGNPHHATGMMVPQGGSGDTLTLFIWPNGGGEAGLPRYPLTRAFAAPEAVLLTGIVHGHLYRLT